MTPRTLVGIHILKQVRSTGSPKQKAPEKKGVEKFSIPIPFSNHRTWAIFSHPIWNYFSRRRT